MAAPKNVIDFRNKYMQAAIEAAKGTPIFPETILSAAGLESGYGKSALAAKYNNFFGIKADASWKGKKVNLPTKEQKKDGTVYTINAYFRHYDSPVDSFKNYVKFISGPRYVKAGVTTAKTPEHQFAALKKAGYATAIDYPEKLTAVLKMFGGYFSNITPTVAVTGGASLLLIAAAFFF